MCLSGALAHTALYLFLQVGWGEAAVGVTSLSFSHFDPDVFVVGVEGGYPLRCSATAQAPALPRPGGSAPLRAPADLAFSPHAGPVYSVSCSPFHRQVLRVGHYHCLALNTDFSNSPWGCVQVPKKGSAGIRRNSIPWAPVKLPTGLLWAHEQH